MPGDGLTTKVSTKDAYLQDLDAQIERLTMLRALVAAGGDTSAIGSGSAALAHRAAAETEVHPGSFLGMSVPQATRRFLEIMGKSKPQTPQAIAAALVQGNQDKPDNEPTVLKNVYTAFKRGKNREGGFAKVGKLWGLAEWYPAGALTADSSSGKKKRKVKKKGKPAKAAHAGSAAKAKGRNPFAAYNAFVAEQRKAGKTEKEISEAWKTMKAKGGG